MHTVKQRADASFAGIRHRPVIGDSERKLFMLGTDAKLRLRLAPGFEPRDEFVARFDRRHVDLVTGHLTVSFRGRVATPKPLRGSPARKGRDDKHAAPQRAMHGTRATDAADASAYFVCCLASPHQEGELSVVVLFLFFPETRQCSMATAECLSSHPTSKTRSNPSRIGSEPSRAPTVRRRSFACSAMRAPARPPSPATLRTKPTAK